jgi:hypothetical protein
MADLKASVEHASAADDSPPAYPDGSTKHPELEAGTTTGGQEAPRRGGLQPPAIIANMTPERRQELEKHLRKKIDLRLLPTMIIMVCSSYARQVAVYGFEFVLILRVEMPHLVHHELYRQVHAYFQLLQRCFSERDVEN